MTSTESLTATQFFTAASQEAKFYRQPVVEDALSKTISEIEIGPTLAQSRLLTRILVAVARQDGEFRRADLTMLSVKALAMIDSVIQGHASGKISAEDCRRAATRVEELQSSADA